MEAYKLYINGEWVPAATGAVYEDYSPYSGELFARAAAGTRDDVVKAVDAAAAAYPKWAKFSPIEKRKLLFRAADIFDRRVNEFADVLSIETGAASPFAHFQASTGAEFLREAAAQVFDVHGQIFPSEDSDCVSMAWRQPVGVVGCISPWNSAMNLALRAVSFPLAYGNTVVLKTSEASAVSGGVMIAQVFEEAGFPKGVFNMITTAPGGSDAVGDVFTSDPRVRRITFTGSTAVGRALAAQCGINLKRICLELGGSCPMIVLDDADLELAVNAGVFGRFMHQGQVCMSTKRIIVEKGIANEFIQRFTDKTKSLKFGDPTHPDTIVGPMINKKQIDLLISQVGRAREQGAQILCGGHNRGLVYEPTALIMAEHMDIAHEEVFGPVATIIIANDDEDALRIANNTNFGLSSGIITRDIIKAWDLAEKLESGCCHINDSTMGDETHAPLGGMKDSGWGNNGMRALEEFTETRWVTLQKRPRRYMF